ncbi:Ubiquitin-like protease [Legionella gratiana]|uniref:Ubiquitin-like protease n=1 Tax=Legionella gratiana TaxID=45066 RepID=A0A378J739_9GAMM|nr:Ulp1 family isopeptidase [Legionella gratiana]KTD10644.1 Ubiquitin-like protease [Legionella gratiana]STX43603.1 Ubiquitin-like protease [Legionella gratiana]
MPNTDTRRVREDYWYTSAQIIDVGNAWQLGSPERLFLYSSREYPDRTAFEACHVPQWDDLPKKILLPLNLGGNHWTAIAIDVSQGANHRVNVTIWYTDSLNANVNFANHAPLVRQEIARVEGIFRQRYGSDQLTMRSAIYPYTWTQPDGSSCGPYSLANGVRCLDNRRQEANPGRKAVREQQLDMMTQGTAINSCSTCNAVDEILLDWIIDRAQNGEPLQVITEDDVLDICAYYAYKHNRELNEIIQIFHNEYCSGTINPSFRPNQVNVRVREIIGELGIQSTHYTEVPTQKHPIYTGYEDDYSELSIEELIEIYQLNEPVQQVAALIAQENVSQKIDSLRKILSESIEDEVYALELMQQITLQMYRGHQAEAENLMKDVLGNEQHRHHLDACFRVISDVIGMRKFSQDNDEKFIYLASAYKSLADAMSQVKTVDLKTPKNVLDAHVSLLQGAIDRNNASLLRQVCFAIKDFSSAFLEFITGGIWQSDIKRITVISERLKTKQGNISIEQLQQERHAIETILNAKASLERELGNDLTFQNPKLTD